VAGKEPMADSASNARLTNQFFFLLCKLYFSPFSNSVVQKKGIHLNTIERFHIHKEAAQNNHLSDDHTITANRIFHTIFNTYKTKLHTKTGASHHSIDTICLVESTHTQYSV
jgi:hypothetical protein